MRDPNALVHDGTQPRFYEVFYMICADPKAGRGYWFRYTLLNPEAQHEAAGAALWAGFCDREHREGYGTAEVTRPV